MLLIDVPHTHIKYYLNILDNNTPILIVDNYKNNCKYSNSQNVIKIENIDKIITYNIYIYIVDNIKNKEFYEKHINNLSTDKPIYLFSIQNFIITNRNCIYSKTIKLQETMNILQKQKLDNILRKKRLNNPVIHTDNYNIKKPLEDIKPVEDIKSIEDIKPVENIKPVEDIKPVNDIKNVNVYLQDNNKNKLCLLNLEKFRRSSDNVKLVNNGKKFVYIKTSTTENNGTTEFNQDDYLNKLNDFCELMNIEREYVLKNPKQEFRYFCYRYLDNIRLLELPEISRNKWCEAVLIEFRCLPHLEFLIRNVIHKLGENWSQTIVCGLNNYNFINDIVKNIDRDIKIIKLEYDNLNQQEYNDLLMTIDFWNLFNGEKLLIHQEDSCIFKSNIDDFLEWDYIGAPWSLDSQINKHSVSNGGLSLRSRSKMIEILNKIPIDKIDENLNLNSINYKSINLDHMPEDIYFSQFLQIYNIGSVADFDTAKRFSCETIYSENPFGMHCMWNSCEKWQSKLYEYFFTATDIIDNSLTFSNDIELNCSYLNEKDIRKTILIYKSNNEFYNEIKNSKIDINDIDNFILTVDFYNGGGGTTTFINSIISKYKYYNNFVIIRNINKVIYVTLNDDYLIDFFKSEEILFKFLFENQKKIKKIFVNHFLGFSYDIFHHLTYIKIQNNIKMYTVTHDYSFIFNSSQLSYNDISKAEINKNIDINIFDEIITQNSCNINIFSKFLSDSSKIKVAALPDYYYSKNCINRNIGVKKIGIIGNISKLKGNDILIELIQQLPHVQFIVFGLFGFIAKNVITEPYNSITELNDLLVKYQPNIMLELSIWPETYSYVFTLYSIIKIPLIILDKPDTNNVIINRAKNSSLHYLIAKDVEDIKDIINSDKLKSNFYYTIYPKLRYSEYWNNLFIEGYDAIISEKSKTNELSKTNQLQKYAIYFPQFHSFDINDKLFYKNYTDAINLNKLVNLNYNNEILTPSFKEFNINHINEYDIVKNENIIKKDCELLNKYNIDGLACYYYWFSINSENNDNMLMREAVDYLFDYVNTFNRKIFFIWANENWTSNIAMGKTDGVKLENTYNDISLINNFQNLILYFNKDCYLKINNKPVFMIYHTFNLTEYELNLYINKLNELCILNGFSGIDIYINTMNCLYRNFDCKKFYINFNYKINTGFRYLIDTQNVIDFEKYIDFIEKHSENNIVQTIALDFDNNARLIKPNRQINSTVCVKNYHFLKVKFIKMILSKYLDKNTENIILINSLNEWGEKMSIEPSNEIGYYYLNLINNLI
jgi:hypothetical protein